MNENIIGYAKQKDNRRYAFGVTEQWLRLSLDKVVSATIIDWERRKLNGRVDLELEMPKIIFRKEFKDEAAAVAWWKSFGTKIPVW